MPGLVLIEFGSRLNLPPRSITQSILPLQLPAAVDRLQIPLTLGFSLKGGCLARSGQELAHYGDRTVTDEESAVGKPQVTLSG